MANQAHQTEKSQQNVLSNSFDKDFNQLAVENLGYDGQNLQRMVADNLAMQVVTSGSNTYIAVAAPGSSTSSAVWQAKCIDGNGNTTWANGSSSFTNVATNLAGLTYS
jgi:hypothetical protein